MFDKQ